MISSLEIFMRCGDLSRLALAAKKKSAFVQMQYSKDEQSDVYEFRILNFREVRLLSADERTRLEMARPIVRKVIARFQRELESLAYACGLERSLWGYGFGRNRSTYRAYRPTPSSGFKPGDQREVFQTFMDGRSVRMIFVPFESDRRKH
ncbi:MAG TPA: hypothetical protein VL069_08945 [Opitutus sp.]|nr:hypothetical protein [Opitutus sp.]